MIVTMAAWDDSALTRSIKYETETLRGSEVACDRELTVVYVIETNERTNTTGADENAKYYVPKLPTLSVDDVIRIVLVNGRNVVRKKARVGNAYDDGFRDVICGKWSARVARGQKSRAIMKTVRRRSFRSRSRNP